MEEHIERHKGCSAVILTVRNKSRYLSPVEAEMIFFDKGGTLSKPVIKDIKLGTPYFKKIMAILGAEGDPDEFGVEISLRDKAYKKWALDSWIELSEEDRCIKHLFPEYPKDLVAENAEELTLLFSHSKGVRELRSEALPVIRKLHERNYRIGIISNTVSRVLVPGELDEAGITPFVENVVMSSILGIRKPDPEIFRGAAELAGVSPEKCVYIGDQPNRDVVGPRRSGFGLNIILKTSNFPDGDNLPEIQEPDIIIDNLMELLELFPPKAS